MQSAWTSNMENTRDPPPPTLLCLFPHHIPQSDGLTILFYCPLIVLAVTRAPWGGGGFPSSLFTDKSPMFGTKWRTKYLLNERQNE